MLAAAQEDRQGAGTAGVAPRGGRVGVTRLVLTDFRNYRSTRLDLDSAVLPVVLTGPNGAGKTNLLEAMSFLSPGRGLRNARLSDIDRRDAASDGLAEAPHLGWAVAATVETPHGPLSIGTGRVGTQRAGEHNGAREGAGGERRTVRIDGAPARGQAALAERLGVLWLTPPMDRLFVEGPTGRRRLLDRLVLGLDAAHAARVARYEQALRERSRLLREGGSGGGSADPAWLAALEEVMAAEGVAIAAARRDAVERLDRVCAEGENAFPRARLNLVGTLESWLETMPALAVEERFRAALAHSRATDAPSGGAGLGPHRSDLGVFHAEKNIAAEAASTGEQKALLIAIVFAQARLQRAVRGEPPLILLDEVAAHLDAPRRAALFEVLAGLDSQVWITGTDTALFAPLSGAARFLTVSDGALTETD
ncbi:MAG TPA: DNA replication/repair protein RecF [Stellaceae bacterium]